MKFENARTDGFRINFALRKIDDIVLWGEYRDCLRELQKNDWGKISALYEKMRGEIG